MIPLHDRNPTQRRAYVTIALIAINIFVWIVVQGAGTDDEFVYEFAAVPCELTTGEPVTLQEVRTDECRDGSSGESEEVFPDKNVYLAILFSMFLHGSWLHIGGNMLFLWVFGNNIEDRLGPILYLAFYVAAGVAATVAQVAIDTSSVIPMIGASGAIAGVMGAYLVLHPRAPIVTLVIVLLAWVTEVPAWLLLSLWFVLQFFTDAGSGVAWMAHVGGFVFGVVCALLFMRRGAAPGRRGRPQPRWVQGL